MGYDQTDCWMTCAERDRKCAEFGLGDYGDPWSEIERLRGLLQRIEVELLEARSQPEINSIARLAHKMQRPILES